MRKIFKSYTCQTHEGGAGKGDLFESDWRSTGTAQQLHRLPHKVQRQRAKKSGLEGVGAGDSKKKRLSILFLGQSTHRQKADILSFPSWGRPPPTFHPITVFSSLGATKKKSGTAGYCGTAYAVPCPGNHRDQATISSAAVVQAGVSTVTTMESTTYLVMLIDSFCVSKESYTLI